MFSLKYCKDLANLLFWVPWACLALHTQSDTNNLWKNFVFICRQKFNFISHVFLKIFKDIYLQRYISMQTSYFQYFGCAWLCTSKMIVSTCRKLQCLSACQNKTSPFTSFLRLQFKESCNLIG